MVEVEAPYGVNPRTNRPYTTPPEQRLALGEKLAKARKDAAARRGVRAGARNMVSGKGSRAAKPPGARPAAKKTDDKPTPAYQIAGWVHTGASLWFTRNPVKGSVLMHQAATLGPVLETLAEEDARVRSSLEWLVGLFGPAGAWSEAGAWVAQTGAALVLAGGRTPGGLPGMALAMLGGAVVESALAEAAVRLATIEAKSVGGISVVDPARIEDIRAHLVASIGAAPPDPPPDDAAA